MKELLRLAGLARRAAYAPYSKYAVGAALKAGSGQIYIGANVENASFGLSMCAERVALFSAVSSGERRIQAIAIQGPGTAPCFPCGACRQVLWEFGSSKTMILVGSKKSAKALTLGELLKHPFGNR